MKSPLDLIPNGWGTYVSVAILFGATVAQTFGWIDDTTYQKIVVLAGGGAGVFIRRAMATEAGARATGQAVIAAQVGVPAPAIQAKIAPPPQPPTA